LTDLPIIGPYMTATQIGANATSRVAQMLGILVRILLQILFRLSHLQLEIWLILMLPMVQ